MQILKDRIRKDGKIREGNVLKVDSFLNHQMDVSLFREIGKEFKRRFEGEEITKILTIEASGIGIACVVAEVFNVPVVFAKKTQTKNIAGDVYTTQVESYTHGRIYDIIVSREFLGPDDKVLLMTSCESGAYNTVWLAWLVSRQRPYVARQVRLTLPFQPPGEAPREIELINASYDDRRHELVTLDKGRGAGDCGIQPRWRFDGQRFSLSRYAQQPTCDNWQGPDAWPTLWITR